MDTKKSAQEEPVMLFSKGEVQWFKNTFGGKDNEGFKLLRRLFLPTLLDPNVPEQFMGNDMWMNLDFANVPTEQVKPIVLARQDTIKHVLGSLIRLRNLANQQEETSPEELKKKQKAESMK